MRNSLVPVVVAAVLAVSACAPMTEPGGGDRGGAPDGTRLDADAAWVHGGSMIGLLTWGSSSCPLWPEQVDLVDGVLEIVLAGPGPDQPCTDDLAPRIAPVAVPDGVDPGNELRIEITAGDASASILLEGDSRLVPHGVDDWELSAGWFDDLRSLALLTFGSSSCPPIIDAVTVTGDAEVTVRVAEPEQDRPCTMDMAPRISHLQLESDLVHPESAELVLSGAEFDGVRIPVFGFEG